MLNIDYYLLHIPKNKKLNTIKKKFKLFSQKYKI